MGKIFILPDRVSNRIAAGEVVDKPASVVKELIENSIDSGAKEIEVRIEGSGRKLIQVSDDGCGMDYDDAIISLERHSTSKIKNPEDLDSISTLGFRGEALASIASVSRLTLLTKILEESAGTRVEVAGGKLLKVEKAAREPGTTIRVEELFFNTPARLKFLKSDSAEMRWIVRILTNYAVIYKDLKFTVFDGGKVLFRVSPAKTLFERIHGLAGTELARSLLPFEGKSGEIRAFGYCSHTNHKRSSRDGLHFYINGRSVDDKLISSSVAASYKSLIPPGSYPSVYLFVELPFDQVDVNVHPAKMEARFRSPNSIRQVIEESIRSALIKSSPVLKIAVLSPEEPKEKPVEPSAAAMPGAQGFSDYLSGSTVPLKSAASGSSESPKEEADYLLKSSKNYDASAGVVATPRSGGDAGFLPGREKYNVSLEDDEDTGHQMDSSRGSDVSPKDFLIVPDLSKISMRLIGQFQNSFIIAQTDDDLMIIDQHVAHERIRYEEIKARYADQKMESQGLLIPETFEVTREDDIILSDIAEDLTHLGFQAEPFGERTWAVKAVPSEIKISGERIIREIIDLAEDIGKSVRGAGLKDNLLEEVIALIACRGSVSKNMPLERDKMEWLLSQLALCKEPYRCPHGRPVILRIERNELFKKFGRDTHK
jgi:DNA mismatch repair protein MutL